MMRSMWRCVRRIRRSLTLQTIQERNQHLDSHYESAKENDDKPTEAFLTLVIENLVGASIGLLPLLSKALFVLDRRRRLGLNFIDISEGHEHPKGLKSWNLL